MDLISRQAAIDAMAQLQAGVYSKTEFKAIKKAWKRIKKLPSTQPSFSQPHENDHSVEASKMVAQPKPCEYCNEDADGFVTPIEKNSHAFIRSGMDGWELSLKANGWHGSAKIMYCPMCGRRLSHE